MKVTREQAAENRERIIRTAARLFREKGFDGIGVADLMKSAGLTHGGFYGHFASKADLAAKACESALGRSVERWTQRAAAAETAGDDVLTVLVRSYVNEGHRDNPGAGCMFGALGPDAARQELSVKRAMSDGLRGLIAVLEEAMPGATEAERHEAALAAMSQMTGAIMLSRIADDEAFSKEILEATLADLMGRGGRQEPPSGD